MTRTLDPTDLHDLRGTPVLVDVDDFDVDDVDVDVDIDVDIDRDVAGDIDRVHARRRGVVSSNRAVVGPQAASAKTARRAHPRDVPGDVSHDVVLRPPGAIGSVAVSLPGESCDAAGLRSMVKPDGRTRGWRRPRTNGLMPMDPAIAQRRARVRTEHRYNSLRIGSIERVSRGLVVLSVAIIGGIVLGLLLLRSPWFAVQHIDVRVVEPAGTRVAETTGLPSQPATVRVGINEKSLREEISAVAKRELTRPLLRVDADRLSRELNTRQDAGAVRVVKHWPDKLEITVTPRVPLAEVQFANSAPARVDRTGAALSSAAYGNLPIVHIDPRLAAGSDEANLRINEALQVLDAMDEQTRSTITGVDHFGSEFVLRSGVTSIVFGRAELLDAKSAALRSLRESGRLTGPKTIDVTVPDAVVLNG